MTLPLMRTGTSTVNYLLGDHLGSQSITTNSSGMRVAEERYMPWGESRYTYGTTPTTYRFTGQRVEAGLGLYFYNARWLDPSAGRFISADTLIPEQQGVQAWDRYSYVNNNPVKYIDPSGHWLEIRIPDVVGIITLIGGVAASIYDTFERRHDVTTGGCDGTLPECFSNNSIRNFSDHEQINQNEFNDMLSMIYDDIQSAHRTAYDPARATYDTPFYDGNPTGGEQTRPDQTVCFGNSCYQQSAVNYVAQGMYSASSGQSLEDSVWLVEKWNQIMFDHPASEEEIYWMTYGYNYYMEQEVNEP